LFEYLYRVDGARNRQEGGSGLGLSICKHIVEGHNGEIVAEKADLGGLAIIIRLPTI
jgi:two-component system sensor histidine kinase BaeS